MVQSGMCRIFWVSAEPNGLRKVINHLCVGLSSQKEKRELAAQKAHFFIVQRFQREVRTHYYLRSFLLIRLGKK
jgi:hypothetical protein